MPETGELARIARKDTVAEDGEGYQKWSKGGKEPSNHPIGFGQQKGELVVILFRVEPQST